MMIPKSCLSVRTSRNHLRFVNISPTLVIDTSMERSLQVLATASIVLLSYAIQKYSSRFRHISVLTSCTFMFRQVLIIEPSFCNTTSGMHCRPIQGRHLF